ncbi:hypothetical protein [Sphingomonas japonica]|uniref:Uncharacterized protein n=1 Tax=Sphingomonas japonica TaxID=511662 RepID=A0ABX0U7G6_9SPHN|nr:hypothetical protein [Sphingomonas japonica]NIJ25167.1 hypothetical protein [Sphingomonas japonica]
MSDPQPQPHRPGTVERAYELARTGDYTTIEQIRAVLIREQHVSVQQHLSGPTLRRELLKLCRAVKTAG